VARQVVGWGTPAVALIALFAIQFAALREEVLNFRVGSLVVLVVGVILGVAGEYHARLHPAFPRLEGRVRLTLWILPGLLVWSAGLALVLWRPDDLILARGMPLLGAVLVGLAIFAQDREMALAGDAPESTAIPKQLLSVLTYLAAFGLFTLVYQIKDWSVISSTRASMPPILVMCRKSPVWLVTIIPIASMWAARSRLGRGWAWEPRLKACRLPRRLVESSSHSGAHSASINWRTGASCPESPGAEINAFRKW